MKAIVVRDEHGVLVCFGPDNGAYDPGVPAGCTKRVEDDYDRVYAEDQAAQHPEVKTRTKSETSKTVNRSR